MKVWLIQEGFVANGDAPLYWTNKDGWIDAQDEADTFSDQVKKVKQLPMGGTWVEEYRQYSTVKKDLIEVILRHFWREIGIDPPNNYEKIVQDCYEDVCETADIQTWHPGDVAIAFRRWIENKSTNEWGVEQQLKQEYKTLSKLDSDPKSKHQLHIKIESRMSEILTELQNLKS